MALIYVLREPLGVILVVLAFLVASFFIDPFQQLVGLPKEHALDAGAVISAVLGTLLCLAQFSLPVAQQLATKAFWASLVRSPRTTCMKTCTAADEAVATGGGGSPDSALAYAPLGAQTHTVHDTDEHPATIMRDSSDMQEQGTVGVELRPMLLEDARGAERPEGPPAQRGVFAGHTLGLLLAFSVLALTAGIGIVITTYFEKRAGLNMFGYAAIDQILLPVTSLPIAWLLYQWPSALRVLGEPHGDIMAAEGTGGGVRRSFWAVMVTTWREIKPHVFSTLIPYRGTMFAREFVFFYLATAFSDINSVYLTMTLVRVVLCWLASLLACSYLSGWVGISKEEAATTLHAANLALRTIGSGLIVVAIVRLSGGS